MTLAQIEGSKPLSNQDLEKMIGTAYRSIDRCSYRLNNLEDFKEFSGIEIQSLNYKYKDLNEWRKYDFAQTRLAAKAALILSAVTSVALAVLSITIALGGMT